MKVKVKVIALKVINVIVIKVTPIESEMAIVGLLTCYWRKRGT